MSGPWWTKNCAPWSHAAAWSVATSAGAAVMSRVMIRSGNPVAEVGTGFGLIDGAVIDQHFLVRKREPRLRKVLEEHPGLVGYGVDEGTALILRGRRLLAVGASTVSVCLPASRFRIAPCEHCESSSRRGSPTTSRCTGQHWRVRRGSNFLGDPW